MNLVAVTMAETEEGAVGKRIGIQTKKTEVSSPL